MLAFLARAWGSKGGTLLIVVVVLVLFAYSMCGQTKIRKQQPLGYRDLSSALI
jgi:hypothetical protein